MGDLPFEIKPSTIAGLGAFATQTIKPGDFIGFYDGDVLTDADAWTRTQLDPSTFTTMFSLGNGYMVDGSRNNCGTARINHACTPNASCHLLERNNGERLIGIYCIREILAGQEITYDYALECPAGEELTNYRCFCGAPDCFGTMALAPAIRTAARILYVRSN